MSRLRLVKPPIPLKSFAVDPIGIFLFPASPVRPLEWLTPIDGDGDPQAAARSSVELQPGVGLTATGENRHEGPITSPEDAGKRLFVDATGVGRRPRMAVDPDSGKLLWPTTGIDLVIEELSHRPVIECHGDWRAVLLKQHELIHIKQIGGAGDAETADFGGPEISQEQ